jgi:outer membrane protein
MKKIILRIVVMLLVGGSRLYAQDKPLMLGDILSLAEKTSPQVQAQLEREVQAKANTGVLSAYYFPHIDAAAVDSTGFPGSGSPTPGGFGGIINSPYRSGLAGDLDVTWTLFDASQGYGLTASRYQELSARQQTRIVKYEIDQTALKLYFDACRYQGLQAAWQGVVDKIKPIEEQVKHFVRTGRYNEVQMLLLQDQMDQAQMNVDTYQERYQVAVKRLGLVIGLQPESIHVPDGSALNETVLAVIQDSDKNPYLNLATDEVEAAKALRDSASAERMPRLYATGSVGAMDNSRLVSENDYSGWVGVSIPVFEGFRIESEEKKNTALYREKNDQMSAIALKVSDLNAQFDETAHVARSQLSVLGPQRDAAVKSFTMAKDRYLNFLGTVNDLEESVRNVAQIDAEIQNAQMDLLIAVGSEKLFNGGFLKGSAEEASSQVKP